MKLLKTELNQLQNIIEKSSQNIQNFEFSKKGGWVSIKNANNKTSFKFIRKNETKLNANQQFEKINFYNVELEGKKTNNLSKNEFLECFEQWILS